MAGVDRGLGALLYPHPPSHYSRLCAACGLRFGRHRWKDDACPNPDWKAGNGQPQWRQQQRFVERR